MINHKNYDDIIYMKHHQSKIHKPMSLSERAAQFAPFAALTGHEAAIKETARLVDEKVELDDYQKGMINDQLNKLRNNHQQLVNITYFKKDDKKVGGTYLNIKGYVNKIDMYEHFIIIDNKKVFFEDIYSLEF